MKKKLNLCIPQWQDSGYTKELYYGTIALKNYIEKKNISFRNINVSQLNELKEENNIVGYDVISKQLRLIRNTLNEEKPDIIFTIGGGCGIEIPLISYLSEEINDLKIIWFDAHGDINSPETSKSKYFHGMPLRFLLEEIEGNVISEESKKISKANLLLLGTRDLDKEEETYIRNNRIEMISVFEHRMNDKKILNLVSEKIYLHIDLDVIDPEVYKNVKCPVPEGFKIEEVVEIIKLIKGKNEIVGISILENIEKNNKEIEKLKEIIEFGIEL